jgi:hypothetical protein
MGIFNKKKQQHHTPIRGGVKGIRNPGRGAWNSLFSCSRQSLQTDFFFHFLFFPVERSL